MQHGDTSRSGRILDRPVGVSRSAGYRRRPDGRHRRPDRSPRAVSPARPARPRLAMTGGTALVLPRAAFLAVGPQRAAVFLTRGLAALIVLAVAGLIAFFIVADERRGSPAEASTSGADLRSRAADPAPLSLTEVFGDPAQVAAPGGSGPYRIAMTHIDGDCRIAATGALRDRLTAHGCTQVVRASLTTPYGDYRVTTGLFNLADAAGAAELDASVRSLVETGDGSFATMAAGPPGTDPATAPASRVGWHSRGHYLLYCVITRPGGAVVPDGDPNPARITAELVDGYLGETVLGRRTRTA
jgi:hypothetical protein